MLRKLIGDGYDQYEEDTANSIAIVEFYYGVHITGTYPLLKRLSQLSHLSEILRNETDRMSASVNKAIVASFK